MTIPTRWSRRPSILHAEPPKNPWGPGGDDNAGPRNPWAVPPGGKRQGSAKPSALDEFLKRARGGGNGSGGGGSDGRNPFGGPNARALWGIGAGIIALAWIAFTSVHVIGPEQKGVVSFLGSYGGTLEPGIHPTWPAPIATVRTLDVGQERTADFPQDGGENLLLTEDRNLVDVGYTVRWSIASPQDFLFQLANPEQAVRDAAESAMRVTLADTTYAEVTGDGRQGIAAHAAERTQSILNAYHAGVRVEGVSISKAVPPNRVADAFEKVSTAQQAALAAVRKAQADAGQVVARARAEAAAFDKVYAQYKLAPEVTRQRLYYETMEAVLAKADKTVIVGTGVTPSLPLKGGTPLPSAPVQPAAGAAQ